MWEQNIEKATSLSVPHLSCYALTVEEKTPLHKQIFLNKKENVDSDKQARQFSQLMKLLKEKGFEHYEVSNFSLPGFRSRHNSSYWQGEKYLGLGPSAHSYNGIARKWNVANNSKYINAIKKGSLASETETLTEFQMLNEYIMISLRTMEGMDLGLIKKRWGSDKVAQMNKRLSLFEDSNLLTKKESNVTLTEEGMLLADGIAADLFII
jgi:oxygen-independent coproporphyrinogen-3 oxidase